MVIEGFSSAEYFAHEHLFPKLTGGFPDRVEVVAPIEFGSSVARDLASVPLTVKQKDDLLKSKYEKKKRKRS